MKTLLSVLYRIICHFSIVFSAIVLFFGKFMSDNQLIGLKPESISVFALFSLIFGLSSLVFVIPKLPAALKKVLHFVINMVGFFSTFITMEGVTQSEAFISAALFVIIYAVVTLLSFLLKKLAGRVKAEKEDVQSETAE